MATIQVINNLFRDRERSVPIEAQATAQLIELIPPPALTEQIVITGRTFQSAVVSADRISLIAAKQLNTINNIDSSAAPPTTVTVDDDLQMLGLGATFPVTIRGSDSTPDIDGDKTATYVDEANFEVPDTTTGDGSAGSVLIDAVRMTGRMLPTAVPNYAAAGGIIAILPAGSGLYLDDEAASPTLNLSGIITYSVLVADDLRSYST